MTPADMSDLWWKTAVFYCVNVEGYLDSNDDGIGDLTGLTQRIDYLADLGVTCLWLMPFYPSPQRDDGYDIADYFGVNPGFGDLGDFVDFIRAAKNRGMRVIVDLVANHTSNRHPWFRAARLRKDSPYRNYYVWTDEPSEDRRKNMFPDVEDGVWTYDERAEQYYQHSFYSQQPDLNIAEPRVVEELSKVIGFWLALGVDGFRVDAVPHVVDVAGEREHRFLWALAKETARRSGAAILLGEVNLPYAEQAEFFTAEDGPDELTMQFDFVANQYLYLSLARQSAGPLAQALATRPAATNGVQWANFIRNHDELTLDQLGADEREEVFHAFAPHERMRIHERGIVRRLSPMLEGDPRRIRMVYSLLFSLPGAPVLYYGEEIGMGENLDIGGRGAGRTPMHWTAEPHAGFSRAGSRKLFAPITSGAWSPEHINVADQRHDPESLLRFITRLTARYRESPEIGWGEFQILPQDEDTVLVHSMRAAAGQLIAVHNFAPDSRTVEFVLDDVNADTVLIDLLDRSTHTADARGRVRIGIEGYGYRWIRVTRPGERRLP